MEINTTNLSTDAVEKIIIILVDEGEWDTALELFKDRGMTGMFENETVEKVLQEINDGPYKKEAIEIMKVYGEKVYVADDRNAEVEYSWVDSKKEAAQEYVDDGDWGDDADSTRWVQVYAWERYTFENIVIDDEENESSYLIPIEAPEPSCTSEHECEHEWKNVREYLNGAGMIHEERCIYCECERITNTDAQDRESGEQGLTSISYRFD
jgi:hypothetical protein